MLVLVKNTLKKAHTGYFIVYIHSGGSGGSYYPELMATINFESDISILGGGGGGGGVVISPGCKSRPPLAVRFDSHTPPRLGHLVQPALPCDKGIAEAGLFRTWCILRRVPAVASYTHINPLCALTLRHAAVTPYINLRTCTLTSSVKQEA